MCGVCGIVDFSRPVDPIVVERMSSLLWHRGPDDSGLEVRGAAGLGFRRLSVIDLAGSHQPLFNEDNSLWMVFNGEIYNFHALRELLLGKGHQFRTEGDGETALHLYEDFGLDFVRHLNGMFALAIWDVRRQRLVLARDRLGIKPLYYAVDGPRLLFASETKSILEARAGAGTLDVSAIVAYMNYSSIPGRQTCFKEIRRLLPGHLATFDTGGFREQRYWDIDPRSQRPWRVDELQESLEDLLRDAVHLQMISDVPLGVFLSGGIDSSLIAALMAQFSSRPVEAFSIGFGAEGSYLDETPFARAVAQRYAMNHHEMILNSVDLLRDFDRVVWHLDEPCGDPAAFLTFALSAFTRKHVTVALSGLGADELFAGYRRYLGIAWQERYGRIPRALRNSIIRPVVELLPEERTRPLGDFGRLVKRFIRSASGDTKSAWSNMVSYLPSYEGPMFTGDFASMRRSSYRSDAFEEFWANVIDLPSAIDKVTYMDLKMYMVDQLLLQQDKMSMSVSLEARVPYLDHRIVELAATVPASSKLAGGRLKVVLKRLAEKYIPMECVHRPKKGFAAPVEVWLRGPLREALHDALSPERVRRRGIFEADFVEWMKVQFYDRGRDLSVQLYQVFLLETWLRLFVDGQGRSLVHRPTAVGSASGR